MAAILCTRSQRVQKHGRVCESSGVQRDGNGRLEVCCHFCTATEHAIAIVSRLAPVRRNYRGIFLKQRRCCHLGIATEHAIYACSFATALCRLCYRASYKMREACEQIFSSSLFGKTDMRLRLLCVSQRHCYKAWLQFCSNLSIRHAPRGRCMENHR